MFEAINENHFDSGQYVGRYKNSTYVRGKRRPSTTESMRPMKNHVA